MIFSTWYLRSSSPLQRDPLGGQEDAQPRHWSGDPHRRGGGTDCANPQNSHHQLCDSRAPFRRRQFPLRVSFFLSLNKGQGQSFKCVGLDLLRHVLSHGNLYVGASCVGCSEALYILAPDGRTKNIVVRKALQWHLVLFALNLSIRSFWSPYNVMWKFAYWDNYSVIFLPNFFAVQLCDR